ncbi:MAG: hypothetical protein HZA51_14190 [Planctomycetes bacterium]|nr:hypothetical protein [Planctomycetota bacterium]
MTTHARNAHHHLVPRATLLATCFFTSLASAQNCNTAGWCLKGDMDQNRKVQLADVPGFVNAIITDTGNATLRCLADTDLDTNLNGKDIRNFVRAVLSPDADMDDIPDVWETNNGTVTSAISTGTNPANADTDGDSIKDGDELFCTPPSVGGGGLNLRALGGSPVRKNLFVEIDWFDENSEGGAHSHAPSAAAVTNVVTAFANSPVTNPYAAANGITMIVDYGQGGLFTGGNLIGGGDTVVTFDAEFNTYKGANFANNRNDYFHYVISCHRYNTGTNPSSGIAEINGDDLIVSLYTFHNTYNFSVTFMHELGHNLNLLHGGNENRNFKPNYNSIMNYRFQFPGIDGACAAGGAAGDSCGDMILNYSTGTRIALDETALNENRGVCGAAGPAIDWDGVGGITNPVMRNINCYCTTTAACGTAMAACPAADGGDSVCDTYNDYNDWGNISFAGLAEADLPTFVHPTITCQEIPKEYQNRFDDEPSQFWVLPD